MRFGWISVFGAIIVVLMLIPNAVYAAKNRGEKSLCGDRFMIISEQVGRYACIILMWLPLLVRKFGFASVPEMLLYTAGNAILLTAYWILFAVYFRRKTPALATALAVIPACIFLFSGILLRHWLLVGAAVLFAAAHIYITVRNAQQARAESK